MGTVIGIIIVAAVIFFKVNNLKKQSAQNKQIQEELEQSVGRLNYIIQKKTRFEQEAKLIPVVLPIGIGLFIVGIILNITGWRGTAPIFLISVLCIVGAVYSKFNIPKKIEEIEKEINYLKEKENG